MDQSTTQARHPEPRMPLAPLTNSAPKPTKAPSTRAFVLSIDLASPVASGRREASNSRVSLVWSGRFHAGQLHQKSGPKVHWETLLQATVARKTRTIARWRARRVKRAMVVLTSSLGALPATTSAHQLRLLLRPRLCHLPPLLLLLHKCWLLSY